MKRKTFTLFLCFLVLTILFSAVPAEAYKKATYDDIKSATTEEMKGEIDALNQQLTETQENLKKAQQMQADAAEKRQLYLNLEALYEDTIGAMQDRLTLLEGDLAALAAELEQLEAEYEEKYAGFQDFLAMIYEEGSPNYLEIILGAKSFSDMLSRLDRQRSLISYSDTLMRSLSEQREQLENKYASQQLLAEEQRQGIAAFEAKQQELEAFRQENKEDLELIEGEIARLLESEEKYLERSDVLDAEFQKEVSALIAAENNKRYTEEQRELAEKLKNIEYVRQLALEEAAKGNKYVWPLPMDETKVTYGFGMRLHPVYKRQQYHYGIDIAANRGDPIYAAREGTVITATYHATAGYYIVIDHGNGVQTYYMHGLANSFKVKKGDKVQTGQQIMSVGTSGTSTGYHLHFEVHYAGKEINPLNPNQFPLIKPSAVKDDFTS